MAFGFLCSLLVFLGERPGKQNKALTKEKTKGTENARHWGGRLRHYRGLPNSIYMDGVGTGLRRQPPVYVGARAVQSTHGKQGHQRVDRMPVSQDDVR